MLVLGVLEPPLLLLLRAEAQVALERALQIWVEGWMRVWVRVTKEGSGIGAGRGVRARIGASSLTRKVICARAAPIHRLVGACATFVMHIAGEVRARRGAEGHA